MVFLSRFVFFSLIFSSVSLQFPYAGSEDKDTVFQDTAPLRKARSLTPIVAPCAHPRRRTTSEGGGILSPQASRRSHARAPLLRRTVLSPHTPRALQIAQAFLHECRQKFDSALHTSKQRKVLYGILTHAEHKLGSFLSNEQDDAPPKNHSIVKETATHASSRPQESIDESLIDRLRETLYRTNRKKLKPFSEILFQDLFSILFKASLASLREKELPKEAFPLFPKAQDQGLLSFSQSRREGSLPTLHEEASSPPVLDQSSTSSSSSGDEANPSTN